MHGNAGQKISQAPPAGVLATGYLVSVRSKPRESSAGGKFRVNQSVVEALLLLLITAAAYVPAMRLGFVMDDDAMLTENPLIKSGKGLAGIWFGRQLMDYFPLTYSSFWVEWRLWGMNPVGYHAVNILLHGVGVVLLWRVCVALRLARPWLVALVFAVHPVAVASVAWVAERKNTLSFPFFLLALLAYLRFEDSRARRFYLLSLGAFLLALLSKTSVVMLPVVLLLCGWWRHRKIERIDVIRTVSFFAMSLVLGLVTVWFQNANAIGRSGLEIGGLPDRIVTAGCAVWFYLWKGLVPLHLVPIYPQWRIDSTRILWWLPVAALGIVLAALWSKRGSWGRAPFFGLAYFVVVLFPVLGFFKMSFMRYSFVADHLQYIGLPAVVALSVAGIDRVGSLFCRKSPAVLTLFWTGLILCLAGLTWRQISVYADSESMHRATLEGNPDCWMAHNNLAMELSARGAFDEAVLHYRTALQIKSNLPAVHNNFGMTLASCGRLDEAIQHYRLAVELDPDDAATRYNLGVALASQSKFEEAVQCHERAIHLKPDFTEARVSLANTLVSLGRISDATDQYEKAVQLDPDHARARFNYGVFLQTKGAFGKAVANYEKALANDDRSVPVRNNLAWLLSACPDASVRNGARAVSLAQSADRLSGGNSPEILDTLAVAYAEAGRFSEAIQTAERGIELAKAQHKPAVAESLRTRLVLYRRGEPYRDASPARSQ